MKRAMSTITKEALREAIEVSEEILQDLETGNTPLSRIVLKALRLALLMNDSIHEKIFQNEANGYPSLDLKDPNVIHMLRLAHGRGRLVRQFDKRGVATGEEAFDIDSIGRLEAMISVYEATASSTDITPDERLLAGILRTDYLSVLESRRAMIYSYATVVNQKVKFSGIAEDIFSRIRNRVDKTIGELMPDAAGKLTSVYENLKSDNPEDWSNAVHSCRRIMKDLADAIFPPTDEERTIKEGEETKPIKLGEDQYINRIIAYIQANSDSEKFQEIVGSHLRFLGDRLDSIVEAAHKGTHSTVGKEEADRYVIYTYLLVGDVLSLSEHPPEPVDQI